MKRHRCPTNMATVHNEISQHQLVNTIHLRAKWNERPFIPPSCQYKPKPRQYQEIHTMVGWQGNSSTFIMLFYLYNVYFTYTPLYIDQNRTRSYSYIIPWVCYFICTLKPSNLMTVVSCVANSTNPVCQGIIIFITATPAMVPDTWPLRLWLLASKCKITM